MRILFLGNGNSPLINNLARELRIQNPRWHIDILSDRRITYTDYRGSFNNVFELDESAFLRKVKYVKIVYQALQSFCFLRLLRKERYDHIHIFFLYPSYGLLVNRIRMLTTSLKISVFGSEFYRTSSVEKWLQGRITKVADQIVASNVYTLRDFCEHYQIGEEKRAIRLFGLRSLDHILIEETDSREEYKRHFGFPNGLTVVACGYNGAPIQNHLKIINALVSGKSLLPENLFLVFPMMMGGSKAYKDEVHAALVKSGFRFKLFDQFMSDTDLSQLRCASDILVQLQEKDQLSGAMLEHVFAGNALITGSWLPYEFLDTNNIFHYEIDHIADLAGKLSMVINELPATRVQRFSNRNVIKQYCFWPNARRIWSELYTMGD